MPEISDAVLAELQGAHRILDAVLKNPKTKEKAQAILKELNPNASIPDYDLKQAVSGEVKALNDKIEKLEATLTAEREDAKFTASFDSAMTKHGITEDGRPKVREIMEKRNIFDPEAAALTFIHDNPAPSPTATSGFAGTRMFDMSEESDLTKWLKNPEGMRDQELSNFYSGKR